LPRALRSVKPSHAQPMTEKTQSAPLSPAPAIDPSGRFVVSMIVLTVVLFLLAVGMLAYRWMITTEPTALLVIDGSEALSGAEASVTGVDDKVERKSVFGEGDRFSLPFYLDAGAYTVKITRNGEILDQREVTLQSHQGIKIDLIHWEPKLTTQPSTIPMP
jgi:hypothetical protein